MCGATLRQASGIPAAFSFPSPILLIFPCITLTFLRDWPTNWSPSKPLLPSQLTLGKFTAPLYPEQSCDSPLVPNRWSSSEYPENGPFIIAPCDELPFASSSSAGRDWMPVDDVMGDIKIRRIPNPSLNRNCPAIVKHTQCRHAAWIIVQSCSVKLRFANFIPHEISSRFNFTRKCIINVIYSHPGLLIFKTYKYLNRAYLRGYLCFLWAMLHNQMTHWHSETIKNGLSHNIQ